MANIPISLDPATELKFPEGKGRIAFIRISNHDEVRNIAYKVKTTAPKNYVVKPPQGIIEAS